MPIFIATLVALAILCFAAALYLLGKARRQRRKERLLQSVAPAADGGQVFAGHRDRPDGGRPGGFLRRFVDPAGLEALLAAADVPVSPDRFVCLSLGSGCLCLVFAALISPQPLLLAICMAGGMALPFGYAIRRRRKREELLVRQLPDALELIVRALRVGQAVDRALKEVGRVCAAPLGSEIRTVYEEVAMGLAFEQALENFHRRFPRVTDIKILCTAFIIQRETGGNLTRILQGLAATIRARHTLKRQVRTLTAEGRTSAIILGVLPLVFGGIIWMLNTQYLRLLFTHPAGRRMLLYAVVSVVSGFMVMRWMTRIDV